jgi:hypothetical protein
MAQNNSECWQCMLKNSLACEEFNPSTMSKDKEPCACFQQEPELMAQYTIVD